MNNKVLAGLLFLFIVGGMGWAEPVSSVKKTIRLKIEAPSPGQRLEIYRSDAKGEIGRLIEYNPIQGSQILDQSPGLLPGYSYYYTIKVYDDNGNQINIYTLQARLDGSPPEAPVLMAEPPRTDGSSNWIGWFPSPSPDLSHYRMMWAEANDTTAAVGSVDDMSIPRMTIRYRVDNLLVGRTYFYFLKAIDSSGNASRWSGPVSSTQQAKPATLLQAQSRPQGGILLSWDTPEFRNWFTTASLTGYRLYRSSNPAGIITPSNLIGNNIPLTQLNYLDTPTTGLQDGLTYYYRLVGIDDAMAEASPLVPNGQELMATPPAQADCDATTPCTPQIDSSYLLQLEAWRRIVVYWQDQCPAETDSFKVFLSLTPDTLQPFLFESGFTADDALFHAASGRYVDTLIRAETCLVYYATIKSKDLAGNVSPYGPFHTVVTDKIGPNPVKNFTAATQVDGSIRLRWDEAYDKCHPDSITYRLYRTDRYPDEDPVPNWSERRSEWGELITTVSGLEYVDRDPRLSLGGYIYTIQPVDSAGNPGLQVTLVVGYCNKPPQIVEGTECFREETRLIRANQIANRLMGSAVSYFFEVFRDAELTDKFSESGWQANRDYIVTPISGPNQRLYIRVRALLERLLPLGRETILLTEFSAPVWLERNTVIPNPIDTPFTAISQRDGSIQLNWEAPVVEAGSECRMINEYKIYEFSAMDLNSRVPRDPILTTDRAYLIPVNRVDCDRMMYFKVTAVDNSGNEGALADAPWAWAQSIPAPDWTTRTKRILPNRLNLIRDTVYFDQLYCEDSLFCFYYQIGYNREFTSLYSDSTGAVEMMTRNHWVELPSEIELDCDSLFIRVRSFFRYGEQTWSSPYSNPYAMLIDQVPPEVPPHQTHCTYTVGRVNLHWLAAVDSCSRLSYYRIELRGAEDSLLRGSKVLIDTASSITIINDTLRRWFPVLDSLTRQQQNEIFHVYVMAVDSADNTRAADQVVDLETYPKPPLPPVMVYYDSARYYIDNEGDYYTFGDTLTVHFAALSDPVEIGQLEFHLETALDESFNQPVFDQSDGWVIPEQVRIDELNGMYYYEFKFGTHQPLRAPDDLCHPFHFRVRTHHRLYDFTSDWSNRITVTPDYTPPRFVKNGGTGPILDAKKRPRAAQYLDWSQYPVSSECSGFKNYILEGSLSADFAEIDTLMLFPPDCTATTISHQGKVPDVAEFPYWYRLSLLDHVGNQSIPDTIPTIVNNGEAMMSVLALGGTANSWLPESYTHDRRVQIELYSPEAVGSIRYRITAGTDPIGFIIPDKIIPPENLVLEDNQIYKMIDTIDIALDDTLSLYSFDGLRTITAYPWDPNQRPIDTLTDMMVLDRTPPQMIADNPVLRINLASSGRTSLNDRVTMVWSGIPDSMVAPDEWVSMISNYKIYRTMGDSTGIRDQKPASLRERYLIQADRMSTVPWYSQPGNTYQYPFLGEFTYCDSTDLVPNQTYYYLIVPEDNAMNPQTGSQLLSVFTDFEPPAAPCITPMPAFVRSSVFEIQVSGLVADADRIRFQISTNQDFSRIIHGTRESDWLKIPAGTTEFTYPNTDERRDQLVNLLESGLTYYIRVQLRDAHGNEGTYYTQCNGVPGTARTVIDNTPPLAVLVAQAVQRGSLVELSWNGVTDGGENGSGIVGYNIYRSTGQTILESDRLVTKSLSELRENPANTWNFTDSIPNPSVIYYYKIAAFDGVGLIGFEQSVVISAQPAGLLARETTKILPDRFALKEAYPNPFNPCATISFDLPAGFSGTVELSIFNLIGQKIRTMINQSMQPGSYRIVWDGTDSANRPSPSGLYFYRIQAGQTYRDSKKMLLIK